MHHVFVYNGMAVLAADETTLQKLWDYWNAPQDFVKFSAAPYGAQSEADAVEIVLPTRWEVREPSDLVPPGFCFKEQTQNGQTTCLVLGKDHDIGFPD